MLSPQKGQVDRQRDEPLLGHFRGVEMGALLLGRTHRMSDDDGGMGAAPVQFIGDEEVACHVPSRTDLLKRTLRTVTRRLS